MSMMMNALSGAIAAQAALDVTSQNTANVMTPGYSRQGVLLSTVQVAQARTAGGGVQVGALLRFSDGYKNLQLWQSASTLGQYRAGQPYLAQLEQVMADDASNLNQALDAFFASLNAASVDPDSGPLREQVLTTAEGFVKRVASLQSLFASQAAAINAQRRGVVDEVNALVHDVAQLNRQVVGSQNAGINSAGLRDERDRKIDELAALVGVQVVDQPDGSKSVSLRAGQPLVVGSDAARLALDLNQELSLSFAKTSFKIDGRGLGGELGGLNDLQAQTLEPMRQHVLELATGVAQAVNGQLALGFEAGTATPGKPLFVVTAGGIERAPRLASELAFSGSAGVSGDSGNLNALIDLAQHALLGFSVYDSAGDKVVASAGPPVVYQVQNLPLGDAYTQLVGRLGVSSQQNQAALSTAQTLRDQADESWKTTSGVNSDEEAINLMQYMQMYQANLKVAAVANELFDATLAIIG